MSNELDKVIQAFSAVQAGEGWRGDCPVCNHNSLIISQGDNQPVVAWCSRDCDKKDVNRKVFDAAGLTMEPFTVRRFCELKKLPLDWVTQFFGLRDDYYVGKKGRSKHACLCFPYSDGAGPTGLKFRFSESSHVTAWMNYQKRRPMLYGLWTLASYSDTSTIVLCEGESDPITLAHNLIPALGIPGAPHGWKQEFAKVPALANADRILVVQEPGDAGKKLVEKIASSFPAGKVFAVQLPAKDPSELWIQSNNSFEFTAAWEQAVAAAEPVSPDTTPYVVEWLSDVVPQPVIWLWPGRIPRGKVTMFAGAPGTGKSLVTCSLAAAVTNGSMFPDEAISDHEPGSVLMFFCEDDAADTVKPRLLAAGANCKKIATLKHKPDANDTKQELALDTDLKVIEDFLLKNPSIKLVTIDPITSYIGNVRSENEKEVRAVLQPVAELAKRTGVAFVLLAHFNKRSDVSALNKVMGAVAMTGVARAVWMFAEDMDAPEGVQRSLMLPGKMSLGKKMKGLEYTIDERQVLPAPADQTPFVKWGGATNVTADKAFRSIGAFGDEEGSKLKLAGEWLKTYIGTENKAAKDVFDNAAAAGIAEKTLRRAAAELAVVKDKISGKSFWRLPAEEAEGF